MIKWYIAFPIVLLLLVAYMFIQAQSFKIRHFSMPTKVGIRFFHMTDIHISLLFISSNRIKKTIEKSKPDYVLFSGDFLERPSDLKKLINWLKNLNIKVPAYAVLGNHEHRCFRHYPSFKDVFFKAMQDLNIAILNNDVVILRGNDEQHFSDKTDSVALIGIRDCKCGNLINNKVLSDLKGQYKGVVAFSHNPDISLYIPENSVDLLIVGHLHGGQIWLPFNLEYLLLRKDHVSKMGHYKGFSVIRKNSVYISRGLGTVLFPFRFLSIPEVTIFDV